MITDVGQDLTCDMEPSVWRGRWEQGKQLAMSFCALLTARRAWNDRDSPLSASTLPDPASLPSRAPCSEAGRYVT